MKFGSQTSSTAAAAAAAAAAAKVSFGLNIFKRGFFRFFEFKHQSSEFSCQQRKQRHNALHTRHGDRW